MGDFFCTFAPIITFTHAFCLPSPSFTPPDCNRPADRSEDPDSDSDEPVQCSEAAVHSGNGWQLWSKQGYPDLTGDSQHKAGHLHRCRQPDARKNTGTFLPFYHPKIANIVKSSVKFQLFVSVPLCWHLSWNKKFKRLFFRLSQTHCQWNGC